MSTIFITGTSSGLGKAAAKLFAAKGWNVIATMRRPENEIELSKLANVMLLPLDVANADQIREVVGKVTDMGVDVVLNNAGYGLGGPLESYSNEQIQDQINTNLLGVIRVTQAFIPYFRTKRSGMFLTTTSIGGLITFPFYSVYSATKWGVEGFCESLSFELNQFGISVKTISPGGIRSNFRGNQALTKNDAYASLVEQMTSRFMQGKTPTIVSEPEAIAEVIYEAATDGKDQLRYQAGQDAISYVSMRRRLGDEGFRQYLAELFFHS
ncbi:MAG TPA: SDR family oxidoreductase [Puia sp.]|nr:SDR family oxidoreductase [Puia sp.]